MIKLDQIYKYSGHQTGRIPRQNYTETNKQTLRPSENWIRSDWSGSGSGPVCLLGLVVVGPGCRFNQFCPVPDARCGFFCVINVSL